MLLCVCVMLLVASKLSFCLDEPSLDAQWEHWKITYGKQYQDHDEEENRRNIWNQNMYMIKLHNQQAEEGKHSYTLGMNQFGDGVSEEMAEKMHEHNRMSRNHILDKMAEKMFENDKMARYDILVEMAEKMSENSKILRHYILLEMAKKIAENSKISRQHVLKDIAEKMMENGKTLRYVDLEKITEKMVENNRILRYDILKEMTMKMADYDRVSRGDILEEMSEKLAEHDRTAIYHVLQEMKKMAEYNWMSSNYNSEKNNITGSLPKSIDYREKGIVTRVKDQGNCGACWAFSAAGALEGQLAKKTGELLELSPQNLVDCVKENNGCDGGNAEVAFEFVQEYGGMHSEEDYPYTGEEQECHYKSSATVAQCKGFNWTPEGDEDALAETLYEVGPLSVNINTGDEKFYFYKSGIYYNPECDEDELNHAVLLVGYGETANGEKYWIVKNSYGESWGEEGYMWIARKHNNHCGIASEASYPIM